MGPDFGERQYEYAVNFELTTDLSALIVGGLPRIPTTNDEAKKGYDALFNLGAGYLYHLQYKVGSYASRLTPKNPKQWARHRGPYYRLPLHADSTGVCSQHLRLEHLRASQPGVYYLAPSFYLEADFWRHAAASAVFDNSMLIDVADVPLPSAHAPHSITYDLVGNVAVWSDEGRRGWARRSVEIRREQAPREISPGLFRELLLDLVDALADERSVGSRVPRAEPGSGLRASLVKARAPDAADDEGRQPREAQWSSAAEARETYAGVSDAHDRAEAAERVERLDDMAVLLTVSRIAALDFGLTTVVEPA